MIERREDEMNRGRSSSTLDLLASNGNSSNRNSLRKISSEEFTIATDGTSSNKNSRRKAPSENTIQVICRFRPLRKNPKKDGEGVNSFRLHTETGS